MIRTKDLVEYMKIVKAWHANIDIEHEYIREIVARLEMYDELKGGIKMKYCCEEFKRWYTSKSVLHTKDHPGPGWCGSGGYFIDYGNVDYLFVDYCPFCGKELKSGK